MKITEIEAIHLRLPVVEEVADGTQDCLLVRVHTDAGLTGLGEVVSCSFVARAVVEAPRSAPFRHGLAAVVEGMEIEDPASVMQAMVDGTAWYGPGGVARQAMSGIDLALWDILGKAEKKPVRKLLNEAAVDSVDCYASVLWPSTPDLVGKSASQVLSQGYRSVKYGWAPMGQDADLVREGTIKRPEAVTLMTLHASKGLEFPVVFLCGVEEGLIPFRDADVEEERRLLFVGITRGKDEVILTRARRRIRFGERIEPRVSRFVGDIPKDVIDTVDLRTERRAKPADQMSLF